MNVTSSNDVLSYIIGCMFRYLLYTRGVSIYYVSSLFGMRIEVLQRLKEGKGSLASACVFCDAFCRHFGDESIRIIKSLVLYYQSYYKYHDTAAIV